MHPSHEGSEKVRKGEREREGEGEGEGEGERKTERERERDRNRERERERKRERESGARARANCIVWSRCHMLCYVHVDVSSWGFAIRMWLSSGWLRLRLTLADFPGEEGADLCSTSRVMRSRVQPDPRAAHRRPSTAGKAAPTSLGKNLLLAVAEGK